MFAHKQMGNLARHAAKRFSFGIYQLPFAFYGSRVYNRGFHQYPLNIYGGLNLVNFKAFVKG
jgi:hypothetical protein